MGEIHGEMIDSSLPNTLLRTRYFALPFQHVESSIAVIHWLSNKAIRMVTSPLFPLLFQTIDNQLFLGLNNGGYVHDCWEAIIARLRTIDVIVRMN